VQQKGESEDLAHHLWSSGQPMQELERTLSGISTQQKEGEKCSKKLTKERDALKLELYKINKHSGELEEPPPQPPASGG
jgi:hypothetical protein